MNKTNIQDHLKKLREKEENVLKEIRQKRLDEQESVKKAVQKQNDEEEIKRLKEKELELREELKRAKKKNFELDIELTSWKSVAKSKSEQLDITENTLNESHEQIWRNREDFCVQADCFVEKFEKFSKHFSRESNALIAIKNDLECEIDKIKLDIAEEEKEETDLNRKLEHLAKEREMLLMEPASAEFKRLEEWIQITRDRCTELERRISDKNKLMDKRNVSNNRKIFSMVKLEDVKRLTRFRRLNEPK